MTIYYNNTCTSHLPILICNSIKIFFLQIDVRVTYRASYARAFPKILWIHEMYVHTRYGSNEVLIVYSYCIVYCFIFFFKLYFDTLIKILIFQIVK